MNKYHQFLLIILFSLATTSCQTVDNTVTSNNPPAADVQTDLSQVELQKDEQQTTSDKEAELAERKEILSALFPTAQPKIKEEKRKVVRTVSEFDKVLVGKWMNIKQTESLEFFEDGTVLIVDESGNNPKMTGIFKRVGKAHDRLKVDFKRDYLAALVPTMEFKISVSENEMVLTDLPEGSATRYQRIH